ncbi:MAG: thioether cross-link-forming SCIFF peptide maturase [Eubacterium sp.]|nr:thioether cross-link-forming SCIFF peptide maturase [Eubacterium sp.]
MIHKFYLNGLYIVLDVESGTVLTVDKMTYDVLDDFGVLSRDEIVEKLKDTYPQDEVLEVILELEMLKAQGLLFTEGNYDPNVYQNHDLIKALCLHVAHDCNLKCNYCFASQGDFNGEKLLMPLEVGKKAIDFIIEQSRDRVNLEVDFFGGEPLMNFNVVKDLVDYARSQEAAHHKKFKFTMTTNGMLLNDEIMAYLDENMDNVVLSLDGRKCVNDNMRRTVNDKGSFDVIIDKIKKMAALREGKKDYYVRGTYTKHNLDFSEDVEFLAQEGFGSISVEPVVAEEKHDYAILKEDVDTICKEYDKLALDYLSRKDRGVDYNFFHFNIDLDHGPCVYKRLSGCGAGRDYVAVTPEGDVYPCHQFVGNEAFKMGDVFSGIAHPEIKEEFGKANLLQKDSCKSCWCRYFCGGGCHANAYNFNQTIMEPYEVACDIERRRVENAIMIHIVENGLAE